MIDDLETRWRNTNPDLPKRSGKIHDMNRFDNNFFGISNKQSHVMDPQMRMLLKHSFEAILDAGLNPKSIHGSRTGVFVGVCYAECESTWYYDKQIESTSGVMGYL